MKSNMRSNFTKSKNLLWFFTLLALNTAVLSESEIEEGGSQLRYTFSWPYSANDEMQPRGGTTRGPAVVLQREPSQAFLSIYEPNLLKKERDRRAILALAGDHRTTFDFIETMGFSVDYELPRPYQSWGTERIYIIQNEENLISLQHVLVMRFESDDGTVSSPVVVKHWRQDWAYEDRTTHDYIGRGKFKRRLLEAKHISDHWTQTVYQVDDSPRYEAVGTWRHFPGISEWHSNEKRRPLPRRESSVRNDYQALFGRHRISVTPFGWIQEEDSLKLVLTEDNQPAKEAPFVSRETGLSRYERIKDYDFTAGDEYLKKTNEFWTDVRAYWQKIYQKQDEFEVRKQVGNTIMFAKLFEMAEEQYETSEARKMAIEATINNFVTLIDQDLSLSKNK